MGDYNNEKVDRFVVMWLSAFPDKMIGELDLQAIELMILATKMKFTDPDKFNRLFAVLHGRNKERIKNQ